MSSIPARRVRLRPGRWGLGINLAGAVLLTCVVAAFVAMPVLVAFVGHDVTGTIDHVEQRQKRRSTQLVDVLVVNLDDAGQRFTTRLDKPWGMLTPSTGDPFVVRVVNVLGLQLTGRPTEPGWPYVLVWLLLSVGACVGGPGRLLLERVIVERGAVTVTTSWTHEPLSKWSASRVRYTFRDSAGRARGSSLVVGTARITGAPAELVVAYMPQQPWLSTVVEFSRYELV